MVIFAFIVDKLGEVYETPYGGLERWHMQLGEEDEEYLRWLRVAQPGDRPYCELTLEQVTLDPGESKLIHVEIPRVQGLADDGNGVAHCSARVEHACVPPVG